MTSKVEFKNVEVSFSTMLNKPDNKLVKQSGRFFKVKVPMDSPELEELKKNYKDLNDKAKTVFGEQVGKKVKNAKSVEDVFPESVQEGYEGFVELSFNVKRNKEYETKLEDGTIQKETKEVLDPIYKTDEFTYMVNNNGERVYKTESGKKFAPLSGNIVNITVSLTAKYNSKTNQPSIRLKAEEVKIVKSDFGGKSSGPKTGFITLDDDEEIEEKVVSKSLNKEELFSEKDLASLDI